MEADKNILQMKYARIVSLFAEQTGMSYFDWDQDFRYYGFPVRPVRD